MDRLRLFPRPHSLEKNNIKASIDDIGKHAERASAAIGRIREESSATAQQVVTSNATATQAIGETEGAALAAATAVGTIGTSVKSVAQQTTDATHNVTGDLDHNYHLLSG